jgi:hypothetical protein
VALGESLDWTVSLQGPSAGITEALQLALPQLLQVHPLSLPAFLAAGATLRVSLRSPGKDRAGLGMCGLLLSPASSLLFIL